MVDQSTFHAWRTTRRKLDVAMAALAIGEAKDAVAPSTVD